MSEATLTAEERSAKGKGPAGRMRREGLVPAVVYGLGGDSVSVTVPARELQHILSGGSGSNTLITLSLGGKEQLALTRQIQRDPVKGILLHVDFLRVRADQTIQAEVPLHLIGQAEGVSMGGMLEQMVHVIAVEAKPADLPPSIEFDVTPLELNSELRVRDLVAPPGVRITLDLDDMLAQVSVPRGLEAEAEEAVEGEAAEAAAVEDAGGEE